MLVVEPEQQRADRVLSALVPAKTGDGAVGRPRVLDLDHRAFAGLVVACCRLRDHAVEPGPFESCQPLGGHIPIAGHRREMDGRGGISQQLFQLRAPIALRRAAEIPSLDRQEVESDECGGHGLRQLRDPGCRGMQAQLQRIEVEPGPRRNDDLSIEHASVRQPFEERLVELGKVTVERPQVAALDEDLRRAAKDDGAKAIPLGLVEQAFTMRQLFGELRQHRFDRRSNRERSRREGGCSVRVLLGCLLLLSPACHPKESIRRRRWNGERQPQSGGLRKRSRNRESGP